MKDDKKTVIILGAGFSQEAKLPIQSEFAKYLIQDVITGEVDQEVTLIIKDFLQQVFLWDDRPELPSVEDLFTMLDLSTASGHNLGLSYPPKKLRALRRMLIYRLFSIIDKEYEVSDKIQRLLNYYLKPDGSQIADFVVLNWDIVLEKHLERTDLNPKIDYCFDCEPLSGDYDTGYKVKIAKVHGSSNWVYCDNCRSLFYDRYRKLSLHLRAGLTESELQLFNSSFTSPVLERGPECRKCRGELGPHIATFSYKKSFRTHAFTSSWVAAEKMLDDAERWIFIGYSLPEADYEFKHLLKTCQLKMGHITGSKEIQVVYGGRPETKAKYENFFGTRASLDFTPGGLGKYLDKYGI